MILDRAIQRCLGDGIDFSEAYGFEISLQVTGDPPPNRDGLPAVFELPKRRSGVDVNVLKPHGSLNWLAPTQEDPSQLASDSPLREGRSVILPLTEDGSLRYFSSTETFQRVQPPDTLPVDVEPVILTPRSAKRPDRQFLRDVRGKEEEAITSADEVYILGWSIPRTDRDQECLIRTSVARRARPFQQVTGVNFLAGTDYFTRLADIFGIERSRLRVLNSGFRDFATR